MVVDPRSLYHQASVWRSCHFRPSEPQCGFVCLFVVIKPETLYFAPCVWRDVITPGNGCTRTNAQTTCVRQRQRHRPRTCQSMTNTLQVDGLVRISGLTPAPYKTHPQPLKDIPPRLIIYVAVGTLSILVDRNYELPANTSKLNKASLHKTRISQNHPGLCSTTFS